MLSPELQKSLQDLQLDPAYVEDLARRTIAEDLDGGEDLTTVSTIPASHTSIAEFRARKAGTVAGVVVAAAVLEVCGITDYEIDLQDGSHVEEHQSLSFRVLWKYIAVGGLYIIEDVWTNRLDYFATLPKEFGFTDAKILHIHQHPRDAQGFIVFEKISPA
jgi:hypothetical protein